VDRLRNRSQRLERGVLCQKHQSPPARKPGETTMSSIAVRKNDQTTPTTTREWDPGRLMRSVLGWDPFREMVPFAVDQSMPTFAAAFEVKETKDSYVFKADVPGVKPQDIEVNFTGNRLTINGKREFEKQEKTDTYYTYERSYGSFTRAFTMPDGIDPNGIHADLRDGVLTVDVAKTPEAQPKKIPIATPQEKKA
jgi:HSP20 family protein